MRRKASLATIERNIRKAERELFHAHLYEDRYTAVKRPGKKSVRAVLHDPEHVELVGANKKALKGVYDALTSGKSEVSATSLRPIAEDELMKQLQPEQQQAATKLLPEGEADKPK